MENKTINQLIKLYEDQITQLEIMSKIELGDDVIEEINRLKSELKNTYTQKEVLQLMYQAFESGFMKYEVVDAGLESMETKEECGWILRRYDSDLEKETQKQLIIEIMNEDAKDGLYKKQTAVEWLVEQIIKKHPIITQYLPNYNFDKEIIQQAKQMEREQIIKAHKEGNKHNGWALRHEHEQYYNEEYGGNNEQQ